VGLLEEEAGIQSKGVERGHDHCVFFCLVCLYSSSICSFDSELDRMGGVR